MKVVETSSVRVQIEILGTDYFKLLCILKFKKINNTLLQKPLLILIVKVEIWFEVERLHF